MPNLISWLPPDYSSSAPVSRRNTSKAVTSELIFVNSSSTRSQVIVEIGDVELVGALVGLGPDT